MLAIYLIETEVLLKSGDFIPNSIRSYGKCVECIDLSFTTVKDVILHIKYTTVDNYKGEILYNDSYIIESTD